MQQTNRQGTDRSVWWWAYFALNVVVLVAAVVTGWHTPLRNLSLSVFYGVGLLGLFGYLRSVAIGHRLFWVTYLFVVVAGAAYSAGSTLLRASHSDALFLISLLLLGVVFSAPTWLALWRYAFRSSSIWQSGAAAA
jgi:hypothetical protein